MREAGCPGPLTAVTAILRARCGGKHPVASSGRARILARMSIVTQRLLSEIETAPEPVQSEVLDFVLFVKARNSGAEVAERIRRTPGVCGGEACIRMTRISVWMLDAARWLGFLDEELLQDYFLRH